MTRRLGFLAALSLALALPGPRPAAAAEGGAAGLVEKEFRQAIQIVSPATVVCIVPTKKQGEGQSTSSGVIVTKAGHVLSDGDAGAVMVARGGKIEKEYREPVEIRIPDPKRGTYSVYHAKVVRRVPAVDSCLLKITDGPSTGFPFVVPRTSDDLHVGRFAFGMGTPFGHDEDGTAALTAGIVCALTRAPEGDPAGQFSEVYTSAAVNPGVNGGPLVDADGTLVGIISTWGTPEASNPFQFLGKVFPIDRIKAAYKDLPDFSAVFPDPKTIPRKSKQAMLLERAFAAAAAQAYPSVASLEVTRSEPLKIRLPAPPGQERWFARYTGPVSAVVVSGDGYLVSSLYSFARLVPLFNPGVEGLSIEDDLAKVTAVTAHFADGASVPAKVVAHDQAVGIVLLKAEMPADHAVRPLPAAPKESLDVGRLVLCVANPFGAVRSPDPLLTLGIVSRLHPEDAKDAWRGDFQTDAGMTDGTVGGALVDVHGRILGLGTLWDPVTQGRNSGIGYGIPWSRIEAALPALKAGKSFVTNGYLGITWEADDGPPRLGTVTEGTPAAQAGMKPGDLIVEIDGKPVPTAYSAMGRLRSRQAGDVLAIVVLREGKRVPITATLAARPKKP